MEKIKEKTNAIRALEQKKIPFVFHEYPSDVALSGVEVAELIGQPLQKVYKTLVTVGKSNTHYVFVVPAAAELDLKKAAKAAGEKSVEMVKSKELLPINQEKFVVTVVTVLCLRSLVVILFLELLGLREKLWYVLVEYEEELCVDEAQVLTYYVLVSYGPI